MDRADEAKHVRSMESEDAPRSTDRNDDEVPMREGDILGLGGSVVPKESADRTTSSDEDATTDRGARMIDTDERPGTRDLSRGKGATGIDMGSGGTGTDVE